jgi:hypothetical protein
MPILRHRLLTIAGALALGLLTTYAIAIGSALLFGARAARSGTVEKNGDHLQLWILRADSWTGSRLIWFEKGRIYNKPGVGPAGGSSAAVACWRFATSTRGSSGNLPGAPLTIPSGFVNGTVELPPDERARILATPSQVWGVAIDRRGWPWPALEGRAAGTMNAKSVNPYVAEVGFVLPPGASILGFGRPTGTFGGSDSLADLRILPVRPLWGALIADTLFMAAAWWMMLRLAAVGWAAVQARRRDRRGLCKHCGYDLAGLDGPTCPECGKQRIR